MKNTIFEITEKTRNRTFKATVKDVAVGDSVMRTTLTVEKTTSESGDVRTVKTRKTVEYEPGDEIPDQECAIGAYFAPAAAAPAGEAPQVDDRLHAVKMSAESVVKIISDEFDKALDSALAADPAPAEEAKAEYPSYDFDSAIDAALDSVKIDPVSETDESELRKAILAQSSVNEPVTETVRQVAAQVVDTPVASPVASPAASSVASPAASPVTSPVASPVTSPPAEPEKKKPFRLADIPDPKQAAYDEAVKELRRQKEAKAAEREAEEAKRAQEVLNSAFSPQPAVQPAAVKRAPTDAEVMDGLEP